MIIYTVQKGDYLYDLTKGYNLNAEKLVRENGLETISYLVEGQGLIFSVDSLEYTINEGDTISSISRKFNTLPMTIIDDNNLISVDQIYIGMKIVIKGLTNKLGEIDVNGYIVPGDEKQDIDLINDIGKDLTYIMPSNYIVNADGSLRRFNDEKVVEASLTNGVSPFISISNAGGPGFDPARARIILSNKEVQNTLFNNMLNIMDKRGYAGVNVNFEMLYPEDRKLYNEFLENAVDFFHRYNYLVSTALAPKTYDMLTGIWWGAHDYKAQGAIVDFIVVMTYDWGCGACPPMAISPANEIRKVLDYAVSVIPREKILMGFPFYGFDWELPFVTGDLASLVDYTRAIELAAMYGSKIEYDITAQVPYFYYTHEDGERHVVWYEDARSIREKYKIVNEYGLKGVSYWVLGLEAPQNWPILRSMFSVAH